MILTAAVYLRLVAVIARERKGLTQSKIETSSSHRQRKERRFYYPLTWRHPQRQALYLFFVSILGQKRTRKNPAPKNVTAHKSKNSSRRWLKLIFFPFCSRRETVLLLMGQLWQNVCPFRWIKPTSTNTHGREKPRLFNLPEGVHEKRSSDQTSKTSRQSSHVLVMQCHWSSILYIEYSTREHRLPSQTKHTMNIDTPQYLD